LTVDVYAIWIRNASIREYRHSLEKYRLSGPLIVV